MKRVAAALTIILLFAILLALYSDRYISEQSYLQDLVYSLENLSSCTACIAGILTPLKALAELGDTPFIRVLVDVCVRLKIQPADVCTGALSSQGSIIAHDLRSINLAGKTAASLCAHNFKLCRSAVADIKPYTVPIPTQRPDNLTKPVSAGRKPFKIVHLSDIHIDRGYTEGSEAHCGKTQCCRPIGTDADHNPVWPARPYGERKCDSPPSLFLSMLDAVNEVAGDATLAVFTGDIIDHAVWLSEKQDTIEGVKSAYTLMGDRLNFPIYGAIGNHDTSPTNAFARRTSNTTRTDWALQVHADVWQPHIGEAAANKVVANSGCYAITEPNTGVLVISLNTNYAMGENYWLYDSDEWQPDPNGILEWLAMQLQGAEDRGQRAWLLGHMTGAGAVRDWSSYFYQILHRYRDTIAVSFFGHSHRSEFELVYTNFSRRSVETASGVTLVGPALTPNSGNPAFAVYEIDPDTFDVVELRTYFANFDAPSYQKGPRWWPYFDARRSYGPHLPGGPLLRNESLDARFWHRVSELFEVDQNALQGYVTRKTTGYRRYRCNERCRLGTICAVRSGVSFAASSCWKGDNKPKIPLAAGSQELALMGFEDLQQEKDDACQHSQGALDTLLSQFRKKARAERLAM